MVSHEQYTHNRAQHELNAAHKEALRAAKIGKKVSKKAIHMAEKGMSVDTINTTLLMNETADVKSVNLAANAELKAGNHDIVASYHRTYDGMGDDYDATVTVSEKPKMPEARKSTVDIRAKLVQVLRPRK